MPGVLVVSFPAVVLELTTRAQLLGFEAVAPLAQLAEQLTLNQRVPGSSPGGRTFDFGARISL